MSGPLMTAPDLPAFRIGIDLGGTKIAGLVFDRRNRVIAETRRPAPRDDYASTIGAVTDVIAELEHRIGDVPDAGRASIGIGMPGSVSPVSELVQNANSTWINGRPFGRDLEAALGRAVRLANDANCFALSEAEDGAGRGASSVFGVIIGTGCGGGVVVSGRLVEGPHAMTGEWGHTPLPWVGADEVPGPRCWCGRHGCMETWVSGTGLAADHARVTGQHATGEAIVAAASTGDAAARASLERHADRLARGLAMIANILDPEVVVLGGGLSQLVHLYEALPKLMTRHMFTDHPKPVICPPVWGDASGVRGAARLWP
jgi:fructokinase